MSTSFQTKIPNSLNEHWMPFSSNKDFKKNPRIIVKAEGIRLKTHDGNTLIDGSSGLYCNPLGHGRKEIIEAINREKLSEEPNFDTIRMLQQMLDDIDNESD